MNHLEETIEPFLTNSFGDRYLYSVNRNAFNDLGSETLYENTYGEKLFAEYKLNIVLGTDSGLLIKHVLEKGIPAGSRYIFVELDGVVAALRAEGCLDDLPSTIAIVSPEEWLSRATEFNLENYLYLNALLFHESVGAADAHRTEYLEWAWNINLKLQELFYHVWVSLGDSVFTFRQFENLAENRLHFSEYFLDAFEGKTAIILAGGPSLKEALPWVKANRDRLVIIAVSRVCRQLIEAGVAPHIIISVDPHKVSFDVSKEMFHFADEAVFLNFFHVTPLLLGQWQGRHLFAGPFLPWESALNKDNLAYTGPTVGNTSISMAIHMGFSTIILAGVDLCHSREGHTHAEGSNESKIGPKLGHVSEKVETYGGWQAETIQAFQIAIPMMSHAAATASEKGCKLYNCALGAAKVSGVEYRAIEEFQLPPLEQPIGDTIQALIPKETSKARLWHYRRIKKEIETARRKFQEILSLVEEAIDCCDGLFGRNGKKADFRHKIRMDKIERKLDNSYRKYSYMVKVFGIKGLVEIAKAPELADDWTDEQIESTTRNYYETYEVSTKYLIGIMDSMLQRIDSRIEEEVPHPDFARLFQQWEKDGQPGRVLGWKRHHPDWLNLMTESERDQADQLEVSFEKILAEEQTSQLASIQKTHDISSVLRKARLLFRRGEEAELEILAKGLATHQEGEKASGYLDLVQGFIAELQGKLDVALEHYHHLVVDLPHAATEDALKQIATLSISAKDIDNAVLAVECLVGLSPAYLPAYADLLKAIGRYEESFDAYNRYLALAPDDVSVMMKLGIFCKEAGLGETAVELFQRVLVNNPDISAAKTFLAELNLAGHCTSMMN
ncbi:6-hydroxymethylpterin diphosphokinase MptE-like protein [Geotalea uraniireducens]|uniref:6-hydroxymethylpterin diphosphokinase MptE-like domain-containing protein n=1 Tax=Geotalea uraniireducens (strain Rf4) TaxID=351605 RepID=A5G8W6_GEOUR|nr:6-hydroxymethylpterin diphosphokinase MptE-like protein [Geotalea uraniireducens]ABQ28234.1 protein of unknown function DUF115 [Geotalea uraniireducens Rf4]